MKNKGCMSGCYPIVLIVIVAIIGFWGVGKYNSLVTKDQNVQANGQYRNCLPKTSKPYP